LGGDGGGTTTSNPALEWGEFLYVSIRERIHAGAELDYYGGPFTLQNSSTSTVEATIESDLTTTIIAPGPGQIRVRVNTFVTCPGADASQYVITTLSENKDGGGAAVVKQASVGHGGPRTFIGSSTLVYTNNDPTIGARYEYTVGLTNNGSVTYPAGVPDPQSIEVEFIPR
jgi:hypothetical protein